MKEDRLPLNRCLFAMCIWVGSLLIISMATSARAQAPPDEGMEVLTRGPVHEAFASVSSNQLEPEPVVPKIVPDPIEELPPDQRPDGDHMAWIPGYWSWDDERADFIWVSGVWRSIPPGRQWIPGYWTIVGNGSQYIHGFWAEIQNQETVYLSPPPASLESGPNSPQPTIDQVWAPGTWVWYENHYAWQPGYWVPTNPNWIWMPAHYQWTPRGYIFVQGYWDYDLDRRGILFAPVYYSRPVYVRPAYVYTPVIALDIGVVAFGLFTLSSSHAYYFGDYYDLRYEHRGYRPWYAPKATRYGYDPLYLGFRSHHIRRDPEWEHRLHEQYRYRREHPDARPPHTFARQMQYIKTHPGAPPNEMIGRRFSDIVENRAQPARFTRLDDRQRENLQLRGREIHQFQLERRQLELPPNMGGRPLKPADIRQPVGLPLPRSPISAPHQDQPRLRPQEMPAPRPQDRPQPPQVRPPDRQPQPPQTDFQNRQEPPHGRIQEPNRVIQQPQPVIRPQEAPTPRPQDRPQSPLVKPQDKQPQPPPQPGPQNRQEPPHGRIQEPNRVIPQPQPAIRPQEMPAPRPQDRPQPPQVRPQDRQPQPQQPSPQNRPEPPHGRIQEPNRVIPQPQPAIRPQEMPAPRPQDRPQPPQVRPPDRQPQPPPQPGHQNRQEPPRGKPNDPKRDPPQDKP
ncbi:YXWGXW repeat-containing protein [Desulfatirhabdium butyrativorans]|uniref:YXWGXW repeat-containing protein n=1 Tax=Desulfatirhabdium butyrativorans TaxID=340467 RepID=UPI000406193A|nr:YXWGXW repeat-containing protein [Desulfatirhabdium butyrativorans]